MQHLRKKQITVNQYWVMLIIRAAKDVTMNDHWAINGLTYLSYLA